MAKNRAEIEAERGIIRDDEGRILRPKEWLEERIEHLKAKQADMEQRIENIKVEIKERQAELKNN